MKISPRILFFFFSCWTFFDIFIFFDIFKIFSFFPKLCFDFFLIFSEFFSIFGLFLKLFLKLIKIFRDFQNILICSTFRNQFLVFAIVLFFLFQNFWKLSNIFGLFSTICNLSDFVVDQYFICFYRKNCWNFIQWPFLVMLLWINELIFFDSGNTFRKFSTYFE